MADLDFGDAFGEAVAAGVEAELWAGQLSGHPAADDRYAMARERFEGLLAIRRADLRDKPTRVRISDL